MKITLSITHNCNLRCEYCYAGEKFNRIMDMDTAKKIIDFAFAVTPSSESIDFGFFGGEPFLELALMEDIIAYIHTKDVSNPITFNITTNGTLFNDTILRFIRRHNIQLSISVDGPDHVHNKKRKYKNGRGTLKKVLKNLEEISQELEHFQVNAVFGPDTIDKLDETVRFLVNENIRNIHLNPDISASWGEEHLPLITQSYKEVADTYIGMYKNNQEVAVNLLDNKLILFLKGGYEASDRCAMGESEFGFSPSGNAYPCERLIGNDTDTEMMMGNIHTGVNLLSRCTIGKNFASSNAECGECTFKKYCMNWCGCTNYHMTGATDKMSAMMCHSERNAITVAKYAFNSLQENSLFTKHMLGYTHKDR
jgi:uncharacterized protein